MEEFRRIAGFPGVWGVIDGTHIPVRVLSSMNKTFFNRKGKTTLNVEGIVGPDMAFIEFVCCWPGSAHDSTVFKSTDLYAQLRQDAGRGHLLGDAGYALEPFLMTPFRRNALESSQISAQVSAQRKIYNKRHCSTRNIVERVFGCWKNKFTCLKDIRVTLDTAIHVITACAALWNFCLAEGDKLLPYEFGSEGAEEEEAQGSQGSVIGAAATGTQESQAKTKRDMIAASFAGN